MKSLVCRVVFNEGGTPASVGKTKYCWNFYMFPLCLKTVEGTKFNTNAVIN